MWGRYCNQTINPLFCTPSSGYNFAQEDVSEAKLFNQTINNVFCQNSLGTSCHGDGEPKVYTLDIMGVAEELNITAMNVRLNVTPSNTTSNSNGIDLLCFARHGAIPSATLHDYSINLSKSPLVIRSPRVGRWYITLLPVNLSKDLGGVQDGNMSVCYSMESKVLECSLGKAGSNCIWEKYILQVGLLVNVFSVPMKFYFVITVKLFLRVLTLWPVTISYFVQFRLNSLYLCTFMMIPSIKA